MLLLHLSDIHFRKGHVGTAMDPNAYLRSELLRDAVAQCDRLGTAPTAVILSGDVAFAGDPEEYKYALGWLEELCRKTGTTLSDVFVIPGNHDVDRKSTKGPIVQALHREIKNSNQLNRDAILRSYLSDEEAGRAIYEPLKAYNTFAGQFFCDLWPPERTIARRNLVLNDGSILRLSGLNSAMISSEADKEGDLFVDPSCFQFVREDGVEHLVMCHHPYVWLRQGDALQDHLGDVAKIHLFGHEHTNRVVMGRDWVRVAANAVHPDQTEHGWEPGYNLIGINVEGTGAKRRLEVEVHVRVWQERPAGFVPKFDHGKDVFRHSIELEPWTKPPACETSPGGHGPQDAVTGTVALDSETPLKGDPMATLRDISIEFFKLTLSQKSAIAGKLNLFEEEDGNQPDFERFRRVFIRARERGMVEALDREIKAIAAK